MIAVKIKNKIIFLILIVAFFSCKKLEKKEISINYLNKDTPTKENQEQKITLPLKVEFSEIRESRISFPEAKWEEIAPNGFIIFDLALVNQHFLISTKYKASDMQINFTLFDESSKKVALLIKQAYYPFDDSLVFVNKNKKFILQEAYTTEYDEKKYKTFVRKKKIKLEKGMYKLL